MFGIEKLFVHLALDAVILLRSTENAEKISIVEKKQVYKIMYTLHKLFRNSYIQIPRID